jgi:putative peptide zinc metalloprotease protein
MREQQRGSGPPTPVAGGGTASADVPVLASGIELLGEYADSGYKDPPHMARRADGQMIQLTPLLHTVAEEIDGQRNYDQIAARVADRIQRGVSADNVRALVDKLRPLGVVKGVDGSEPRVEKATGFLQLRFRTALIPDRVVQGLATTFKPLFFPLLVVAVLLGIAAVDAWLFFVQGVGPSIRSTIYEPTAMLAVLGLVTLSAAFHECGHAAGCKYGGARPGAMGAGIYIVWPAFYTNVTDSYRLGKVGRLRTDLGGIYFNLIFVLALTGVYAATRFEPLLLVILVQHMEILRHFFPFVRLDGYYVFSDLTGVPDLFPRIKPILRSLRPGGAEREPAVGELKRWVRWVVTGWVLTVVPLLLLNVVIIIMHTPRIVATTVDSFALQTQRLSEAWASGSVAAIALGVLQVVLVLLPPLGVGFMFVRIGRKLAVAGWRATNDSPVLRAGVATATVGLAALAAFILLPNGDYKPLQPGERLTYPEAVTPLAAISSGRPALTPERESQLGGAPPAADADESPADSGADPSGAVDASPTPAPEDADATGEADPTEEADATEAADDPVAEPTEDTTATPTEDATAEPSPAPTE